MPVFRLTEDLIFPSPEYAEENGLLAVGGDLSEERIILAYSKGIFPWYSGRSPILWWSPDPRLTLLPEELRISRSLRQTLKKDTYRVTMDTAFRTVIRRCADVHRNKDGDTWITPKMEKAYIRLHERGVAHSVEAWHQGALGGGLYGVALGGVFFGESMFSVQSDASKVAFVALVEHLMRWGFTLIDCQVTTRHLVRFGAREISRPQFLLKLQDALALPGHYGTWKIEQEGSPMRI